MKLSSDSHSLCSLREVQATMTGTTHLYDLGSNWALAHPLQIMLVMVIICNQRPRASLEKELEALAQGPNQHLWSWPASLHRRATGQQPKSVALSSRRLSPNGLVGLAQPGENWTQAGLQFCVLGGKERKWPLPPDQVSDMTWK